MSRELIIKCDLCGIAKSDWVNTVNTIELKFSHVSRIRTDIEIDDCCSYCSQKLFDKIIGFIGEMETSKEGKGEIKWILTAIKKSLLLFG